MLATVQGSGKGIPEGGRLRQQPEPPAAHQDAGQADAVIDADLGTVLHPVGQPAELAAPEPGSDVVDQRLLRGITEDELDLAPAGKDSHAELQQPVGQKVGILRHRVDALGSQPHHAGPAR